MCRYFASLIFLITLLVGCNTPDENSAIKVARNYKIVELTIADVSSPEKIEKQMEKVESFLTEEFYYEQYESKNIFLPLQIAQKENFALAPKELHFNVNNTNEKTILLNYSLELILTDKNNNKNNTKIDLVGLLTLEQVNGDWLIKNDEYNIEELIDLAFE